MQLRTRTMSSVAFNNKYNISSKISQDHLTCYKIITMLHYIAITKLLLIQSIPSSSSFSQFYQWHNIQTSMMNLVKLIVSNENSLNNNRKQLNSNRI